MVTVRWISEFYTSFIKLLVKSEDVLLRRELSPEAICEKTKLSNCVFCNIFDNAYKLLKNILNDVQTQGKGEINTA